MATNQLQLDSQMKNRQKFAENGQQFDIENRNGPFSRHSHSSSNISVGSLTLDKCILLLRQKEDIIYRLEQENKSLRYTVQERDKSHQKRVNELTRELYYYAELDANLQNQLMVGMNTGQKARSSSTNPSPIDLAQAEADQIICAALNNLVEGKYGHPPDEETINLRPDTATLSGNNADPLFGLLALFLEAAANEDRISKMAEIAAKTQANGAEDETSRQQREVSLEEVMQLIIDEAKCPPVSASANRQNCGANTSRKLSTSFDANGGEQNMTSGGTPIALPRGTNKKTMSISACGSFNRKEATINGPELLSAHSHQTSPAKPWTAEEQQLVNELEIRINANIERLGKRELNTHEVSAHCTRLMRGYGIGQRLFARTVMMHVSQSQGSLSELLSKPRPWPKMTERGRDAFRRIFGWLSDDTAIQLLSQLAPRKFGVPDRLDHPDPEALFEKGVHQQDQMAATVVQNSSTMANIVQSSRKDATLTSDLVDQNNSRPADRRNARQGAIWEELRLEQEFAMPPLCFPQSSDHSFSTAPTEMQFSPPKVYGEDSPTHFVPAANNLENSAKHFSGTTHGRGSSNPKRFSPRISTKSAKRKLAAPVIQQNEEQQQQPVVKKTPRFQRTVITDSQRDALMFSFAQDQKPKQLRVEQLSLALGLTARTVSNWFHNQRTRQKATASANSLSPLAPATMPSVSSSSAAAGSPSSPAAAGAGQLDKVIARMHSKLMSHSAKGADA